MEYANYLSSGARFLPSINNPPRKAIYKWYISGIYCQLGDYMPPTTFYGNQKQPLNQRILVWLLFYCVMVSDRISMGLVDLKNEVPKCDRNQVGPETRYKSGQIITRPHRTISPKWWFSKVNGTPYFREI